jgi:D-alanyl-D-alanine carboxypeptidase
MLHRTALLSALLIGLCGCTTEPDPADPDTLFDPELAVDLATALQNLHATFEPPGIVAAVAVPGKTVWVGAVGDADLDGTPLVGDEAFKVASVSKSFVAGLVMTLVDEGMLAIDDTIETWIDGHPRADEITVQMLLNHTAGVPEFNITPAFQRAAASRWTDDELLALVAKADLNAPPGLEHAYSNTHFVMLSMIVEEATESPWQDELDTRVLQPLDLADTWAPDDAEGWGDIVHGYLGGQDLTDSIHPSGIGAAGNVLSNAENLARWARGLWGEGLLSSESTEALTADRFDLGTGVGYGLGTLIFDDADGGQHCHNGALNGYVAWVGYRPGLDVGIAVIANAWVGGNPPNFSYSREMSEALWEQVIESAE